MKSISKAEMLRAQAIALRRAGRSRREIKELLGIGSNATLNDVLAGEPPPEWTRRPRAMDELRARARRLREEGLDYDDIAAHVGVSKSSVSLWVRDMPRPERLSYEECRKRAAEGTRRYWEQERSLRNARREAITTAAAAEIGALTDREILIAGAIAYWCEGAKHKPHRLQYQIQFINSDPAIIRFFLRFLEAAGVTIGQIRFRVYIHETANVPAAERFWLGVTGADPAQFHRTTLKRNRPKTIRKNVGDDYHGCLCISVRRSAELYRRVEGWARAIMEVIPANPGIVVNAIRGLEPVEQGGPA
jgi:transcriptional regulator with XRE-family HTH domain